MTDIQSHGNTSLVPPRMNNEKDTPVLPTENVDAIRPSNPQPPAQSSGDRVLVLMDLDNGLVGWESDEDTENPQ
jgi:predicted HAD superfamily phosphohydrolase YqeG